MYAPFIFLPVEREGVVEYYDGVLLVVIPVVQRLQVLHQVHHRVVVLDLAETGKGATTGLLDWPNSEDNAVGAATCKGVVFVKCFLRVPRAVLVYWSCNLA